jgi:pyridoxal 5'-phosphate synthase pdxT subunit
VHRVGILALQGDVREHEQALRALGVTPVAVRGPADLESVEMIVIPGGESTTISMLLSSAGLVEPLRRRLGAGMPTFGTCAGMILLAEDIQGGRPDQLQLSAIDITVRRNAFGRQLQSFETELDVEGLDRPFPAVFIRAPAVERVGPGVEVLASVDTPDGPSRAVLCRQGAILVSAFHPELSGDARLHELFLEGSLRETSTTKP